MYFPCRREGHQDVQHHSSGRTAGVDLLGHGDEARIVLFECGLKFGEVDQRTRQTVDFVNDHNVDLARLYVGKQLLKRGTLGVAAGEAAVVIALLDQPPAVELLTAYIVFRRKPLGVERVEFLLKAFLVALPGVDRASFYRLAHHFTPKKSLPFQCVPVISVAMADKDRYGLPSNS